MIQEYLNGDPGYRVLSAKYKIDTKLLRTWVNQFKQHGVHGLTAGMTKPTYSKSFKLNVVQYRLEHQLSYRDTADAFDIPNASVITQWQSEYNQYGILGLETKPKNRSSKSMNKKHSKQKRHQPETLNETEREEPERSRIENRKLEVIIALEKRYNPQLETNEQIVRAIIELKETGLYMFKELLETANLTKSVFKYWNKHLPEAHQSDTEIVQHIKEIIAQNKGKYGYRRVFLALKQQGLVVTHKKVLRLMRQYQLLCVNFKHRNRQYKSYRGKSVKLLRTN